MSRKTGGGLASGFIAKRDSHAEPRPTKREQEALRRQVTLNR
jgi:hypothetical protein